MAQVRVQHSFDTEANWQLHNPVLREGEIAISKDDNGDIKLVVGDQVGGVNYKNAPVLWHSAHENLIRHNPSCWERGRMVVRGQSELNVDLGKNYNNPNTDVSGIRYKYRIPVEAGAEYTIKSWGDALCRLYFYKKAEAAALEEWRNNHPSSVSPVYEDTILSDDVCLAEIYPAPTSDDPEYTPTLVDRLNCLKAGFTFTVPAETDYMRLYAFKLNSTQDNAGTASLLELGDAILFKLEKGALATEYTPAPADSNVFNAYSNRNTEPPKNNPVAARQLVNCMASYADKGWAYSYSSPQLTENSENTEWSFEGPAAKDLFVPSKQTVVDGVRKTSACAKAMDCQTPVLLAIAGIPYWQSRYELINNKWRGGHLYPWGKYPDITRGSALAEWAYCNGWEVKPGINYSKLQAGDLVFWRTNEYKSEYPKFKNGFRGWDHVGIFTGRWVKTTPAVHNKLPLDADEGRYFPGDGKGVNSYGQGTVFDNQYHPEVLESGGSGGTLFIDGSSKRHHENLIVRRWLDRHPAGGTTIEGDTSTGSSPELETLFIRIPLETPYAEFISDCHHRNTLDTSSPDYRDTDNMIYTASYNPAVHISGNVDMGDVCIDIYGINAAVWEEGGVGQYGGDQSGTRFIRTGYMPAHWKLQNFIANDTQDWTNYWSNDAAAFSGLSTLKVFRIAFYKGNFEFISPYIGANDYTRDLEIPDEAKYVRYSFYHNVDTPITDMQKLGFKMFVAAQPDVEKTIPIVTDGVIDVVSENGHAPIRPRLAYEKLTNYNDSQQTFRTYKAGYHSYVHLSLSSLGLNTAPAGTTFSIGSSNGEYCISTDGYNWTPLSATVQAKLRNLRFCDGENYIYIPNGHSVYLTKTDYGNPLPFETE